MIGCERALNFGSTVKSAWLSLALSLIFYDPPFKFTGKINKLTFKLEPEPRGAVPTR
jgi:hypothetical protein